ncbi:hypothetical protein KUCAC02_015538 [Chaenocephalus aceratus]|uniref:Uncharacterized protein n=1 Tax=Chaenocephalus aceratus TaxID=36190 RepID=A0ACB9XYP3_CHAAC|nr:hypothetical protein KUCAC02_015538 [Chaenocephalus aceratus]
MTVLEDTVPAFITPLESDNELAGEGRRLCATGGGLGISSGDGVRAERAAKADLRGGARELARDLRQSVRALESCSVCGHRASWSPEEFGSISLMILSGAAVAVCGLLECRRWRRSSGAPQLLIRPGTPELEPH